MNAIPANTRQRERGFNLIETCVCTLVLGLLLAQALPALRQFQQRQRLHELARGLMTDLQLARSEAVQRASPIHFRITSHAGGSCYLVYGGKSADCSCSDGGQAICKSQDQLIKAEWLPVSRAATIRANVSTFSFQPRQGAAASAGSVDVSGTQGGGSIRHVLSVAGRLRSCSPDGSFTSMPRCASYPPP